MTFRLSSSFRDRCGFIFKKNEKYYRAVDKSYSKAYELLMESGLYQNLVDKGLLIKHIELKEKKHANTYKVLKPEQIKFISYPYEWSFSQLKDAALITLEVQKIALDFGMTLKDASAFNIQFYNGRPTLIDTLSFDLLDHSKPWMAYRQFCQHFLGPLALMSYKDIRLIQLFKCYIDGIPLDLVSKILPKKTLSYPGILLHIHLHSNSIVKNCNMSKEIKQNNKMGINSLKGLVDSLKSTVIKIRYEPKNSIWFNYYKNEANYKSTSFEHKKEIIKNNIKRIKPLSVWDLGANTGEFSRICSDMGIPTVSFDIDSECVEENYLKSKEKKEENILPLIIDLTNPSPGIGWENNERFSLSGRGPIDTVMALALIHHLAIASNIPLDMIAHYFSRLCKNLIIEFVPKDDSNAQRLLKFRKDIFPEYTQENFEKEFKKYFTIKSKDKIMESDRKIYLMRRKNI